MAYSPLGGSSGPSEGLTTPYGSIGAQPFPYGLTGGGIDGSAAPMRRGISYDGPSSAASSRPASLLPGAYAPSSSSSQSMLLAGAAPGGRDLYSPMTGVQLGGGGASGAASSASGGSLMSAAASSTSPMAPSPRPYSPSHYAASPHMGLPGAGVGAGPGLATTGYAASAPPAHRSPLLPQHAGGVPPAAAASSFYPQHIAQSYGGGGGGGASSPGSAIHPPLPPPSAPPAVASGPGGAGGLPLSYQHPLHAHTLHHQPSLSAAAAAAGHYHHAPHVAHAAHAHAHPHHAHAHHPHPHPHGHGHSASYSPSSGGGGAGGAAAGGFYAPLGSAASSSTDLRNLSLSTGPGAGASASAHAPAQSQPRRHRGLVRVQEGQEVERAGTTRGGQPRGRRADPAGGFVSVRPCVSLSLAWFLRRRTDAPHLSSRARARSPTQPLKALTTALPQTYHLVNPAFVYETSRNPRRVLTKPSKPASNEGFDNEDSDYILYVNDVLGPEDKDRYLILDVLGQGTFGQVVKCQNMKTHEIVAVKVVKNKPAYFQQSMMEVTILELINNQWDKDDEHHMLRLKDTFIHHSHLCLVFELLSNNLYELIKQNSFRGLSTSLVRVFTAQLLDALSVLNEAKIIHCDLKPENILLKSLSSPTIKVIDFGSACHEKQTVYTYIQSRFYRSPEVILSLPYSSMIDMWSLGCICVELFLGLPLFPGTSEFNQITRIVEMLGCVSLSLSVLPSSALRD